MKNNTDEETVMYLIGTMNDLDHQRQVTRNEALDAMKEGGFEAYFETSAKTGDNVESTFL